MDCIFSYNLARRVRLYEGVSSPTFLSHREVGVTAGLTRTNHLMEQRPLEVRRLKRKRRKNASHEQVPRPIIPHRLNYNDATKGYCLIISRTSSKIPLRQLDMKYVERENQQSHHVVSIFQSI